MVLVCQYLNAQNKISGKISDENKAMLPGASIFLPELNKATVSNNSGYFEFTNLPNGKIKVEISFIGYESQTATVILKHNNQQLDIHMHPTAIETEGIVVTGGYSSTQHENAVKIDAVKINPLQLKSTPNFMEMLTRIPGVDMISKGIGVAKPVIRGLALNDILVLNNGVRFENYQYSNHHPLGIDEFGIGNVEVIKGPASLLYGSDAIGGVINFIKEKPAAQGTIEGDYNLQLFSNSLGIHNNLGIKAAGNNFHGGVRFGQKSNADYLQGGGDVVKNSRFNEISLKTNMGHSSSLGTFNLFYDYNKEKLGLVEPEAIEGIEKRGRKPEIFYEELTTHLISSQNKLYISKLKLDVNAAYQNTELIHFGKKDEYELQMNLGTLTYETKLYLPSDEHSEYIVGFQGLNQKNNNTHDRETILLPDATTQNYAGFGFAQYSFGNLKTQAGVRYDKKSIKTEAVGDANNANYRQALDKDYGSFSGSLGATYQLTKEMLLRANFASAYRTPNIAELTSNGPHEEVYEIGNSELKPENSYEFDLSSHFHHENFTFDIAGFYNKINKFIYITPTGKKTADDLPIHRYEQADAYLAGGEIGVHYHPRHLEWLHIESTFASVIGKKTSGEYLPYIPAHKLNVELRAEKEHIGNLHHPFIALNSHTAFKQSNISEDETPTDAYSLLDLSLGTTFNVSDHIKLSVMLSANNIFDKKYIDHLSTLKEVKMFNPGRNFTLTLKIPFSTTF